MRKRDFLKASAIAPAMFALSGCIKVSDTEVSAAKIIPKQTDIYEISTVLPFDYKLIDDIAKLNQKYKKSKITTLYNNTPNPCSSSFDDFLMVLRGKNERIKSNNDFINYAKYAKAKGFEICYLMNSPKPYSKDDYQKFKNNFENLLDILYSAGIKHIKFANTQTAALVNEYKNDFILSASTALEYHNTSQYVNLLQNYPNINLIDIAIDENHNFTFLKNLRVLFPHIKLELMTNESCIKGCSARISHISQMDFCAFDCNTIRNKNPILSIFRMPAIYPWDLGYYSAIGINNFKITSREKTRADCTSIEYLENYLDCVEYGEEKLSDYLSERFCYDVFGMDNPPIRGIRMSHLKPYLADIEYFVENGHKCASRCGAECHHCEKLAARLENFLKYLL